MRRVFVHEMTHVVAAARYSRRAITNVSHDTRSWPSHGSLYHGQPNDGGKFDRYGKVRGTLQRRLQARRGGCVCTRGIVYVLFICSIMDRWTPWPPWASARNDHYCLWLLLEIFPRNIHVISTGGGGLAIIADYYALCSLITSQRDVAADAAYEILWYIIRPI